MKNSLILFVIALAFSQIAEGGTASVNFATGSPAGLPTSLVRGSGQFGFDAAGIHSSDYVAQLLYSTDGQSFSALGSPQSFFSVPVTSVRAGTWRATSLDFPAAVQPGDTVTLEVAAWDSTQFPSWAAARDWVASLAPCPFYPPGPIQLGTSGAFNYKVPDSSDLNPADYNMSNFSGFTLTGYTPTSPPGTCPEPSVLALGAAGLGVLARRRRRG